MIGREVQHSDYLYELFLRALFYLHRIASDRTVSTSSTMLKKNGRAHLTMGMLLQ